MKWTRTALAASALLAVSSLGVCADNPAGAPPVALKQRVIDVYHGVAVTENYRWLENTDDPAVRRWLDEQNQYSRAYLDAIPASTARSGTWPETSPGSRTYSMMSPPVPNT